MEWPAWVVHLCRVLLWFGILFSTLNGSANEWPNAVMWYSNWIVLIIVGDDDGPKTCLRKPVEIDRLVFYSWDDLSVWESAACSILGSVLQSEHVFDLKWSWFFLNLLSEKWFYTTLECINLHCVVLVFVFGLNVVPCKCNMNWVPAVCLL